MFTLSKRSRAGLAGLTLLTGVGLSQAMPQAEGHAAPAAMNLTPSGAVSTQQFLKAVAKTDHVSVPQARQLILRQDTYHRTLTAQQARLGKDYGGSYLDASGTYVTNVTTRRAEQVARAASLNPRLVPYSESTLSGVVKRLGAVKTDRGVSLSYSVDAPSDKVVVNAAPKDKPAVRRILAATRTPAAMVDVRTVTPSRATGAPEFQDDIYGGLQIGMNSPVGQGGSGCTSGFVFTDNKRGSQDFGGEYLVTAYHCGSPGTRVYRGTHFLGTTDSIWNNYRHDWTSVRLSQSDSTIVPQPWVYNSLHGVRKVNGFIHSSQGDTVCHQGATSGFRCGRVAASNVTFSSGGRTVTGLVKVAMADEDKSLPGDSGGPWYTRELTVNGGIYAYGIHSAGDQEQTNCSGSQVCLCRRRPVCIQNYSYFTPIQSIIDDTSGELGILATR
ncbi:S1 family peptidase [Streptomyces sp. GQFP]|uniref:S1 family peptidase n=1 Tax=Streptomyces sp. GQFP TaxID=2907545 RepID=UPI001F163575|nr:S1 family peptidase [Streptomyces sp. GQFP]UIX29146.1 S1 family peptidase [Streptomyces sp. GQFP]